MISAKINDLEITLASAQVVDPLPVPNGRVVFGATVTIYDPDADQEDTYQIMGQSESEPDKGRISISSPLAKALLGHEEGDEVRFKAPGGMRILEIVGVQ